ncbi:protein of unknown function [Xenorhabdus doucetiae]|uniref:Uncharacterized protein n=1 Tax=Xenorhabdus doucetiae TaxID=351671 RepID=A0A068QMW2_9GAMM|nr:protein of unknown function [Xenorhabdus doucetiae]
MNEFGVMGSPANLWPERVDRGIKNRDFYEIQIKNKTLPRGCGGLGFTGGNNPLRL